MELKQYGSIFWRRAWIAVVLALIVGGTSFFWRFQGQATYSATMRVIVSIPPEPKSGQVYGYDKYYTWLSTEYLVDDFSELVKSYAITQDIKAELNDPAIDVEAIQGQRTTKKTHRLLTITVTSHRPDQAQRIAQALARVMERKGNDYLAQLTYDGAVVRVVDPPLQAERVGVLREYLDLAIRTFLGFLVGLGLIFLMEYLDLSLRDRGQVEGLLGVPVLGEIPPERG